MTFPYQLQPTLVCLSNMGSDICCEETVKNEGAIERLESQIIHRQVPEQSKVEVEIISHLNDKDARSKEQSAVREKDPLSYFQSEEEKKEAIKEEAIDIPPLYPKVTSTLEKHRFFEGELDLVTPHRRRYGGDVYLGELDADKAQPDGLGTMYKQNGSLFIGNFKQGKAQGNGAFIFADGSYYHGEFNGNKAETSQGIEGKYESQQLKYVGGFRNNVFHGFGVETGKTHRYQGNYENGSRSRGRLNWETPNGVYQYNGSFNHSNKFHGKGTLKDHLGVYEGDFQNGQKHGHGSYKALNGTRYVGQYVQDQREGTGTIYNADDTISYRGEIHNNLPHGKGLLFIDDIGTPVHLIEGIVQQQVPQ